MNHLIFTAVLTACLGIGGYQSGPELFGPFLEGLGQDSYYDPGQLNSSQTGPWPPLVSPHSTLSIAIYTSMYYILTYFAGSFGRYNVHAKIFRWLMTVHPIAIALTGFQFANLLPYVLQVISTITGDEPQVDLQAFSPEGQAPCYLEPDFSCNGSKISPSDADLAAGLAKGTTGITKSH
ncbi:hypothetical protein DSO57_1026160 [Entomophthora muscae]|uniref:Uncharacterized protein n=1 Tax=Entomophthora muscae TaxID=34485 RepID=A0ACC2UMN8_9FUNG|nr:hypothetical protein DSO57_1026160 [Entomophthora muscae]